MMCPVARLARERDGAQPEGGRAPPPVDPSCKWRESRVKWYHTERKWNMKKSKLVAFATPEQQRREHARASEGVRMAGKLRMEMRVCGARIPVFDSECAVDICGIFGIDLASEERAEEDGSVAVRDESGSCIRTLVDPSTRERARRALESQTVVDGFTLEMGDPQSGAHEQVRWRRGLPLKWESTREDAVRAERRAAMRNRKEEEAR